jgi:hypothetical protein
LSILLFLTKAIFNTSFLNSFFAFAELYLKHKYQKYMRTFFSSVLDGMSLLTLKIKVLLYSVLTKAKLGEIGGSVESKV